MRISACRFFVCLFFLLSALDCRAQVPADHYFGLVHSTCSTTDCTPFVNQLLALAGACSSVDEKCKEGTAVLEAVFGATHQPAIPVLIAYLDQRGGTGKLVAHNPRLMWHGRNTPHLYGVRDVYVFAFSEKPICSNTFFTTELKTEPNPFTLIFSAIGGALDAAPKGPQATEKETAKPGAVTWYPLSGIKDKSPLWMGFGRGRVDENSVNRIILGFNPRRAEKGGKTTTERTISEKSGVAERRTVQRVTEGGKVTETTTTETVPPERKTTETTSTEGGDAREECTSAEEAGFGGNATAANAFFSNSPASRVGVSVALGLTANTSDSAVSPGRDNTYNGYFLVKYYLRRPQLRPDLADGNLYRPSFALVTGTGVKHTFDEMLFGMSLGHLGGHMGVILGLNSMKPREDANRGHRWHPFAGIEYSF